MQTRTLIQLNSAIQELEASNPLKPFKELHTCYLDLSPIGETHSENLAPPSAEDRAAICALQPNGYFTEYFSGNESLEDLFALC